MNRTNTSGDDTVFEDAVNHSFAYGSASSYAPIATSSHLQKLPDATGIHFPQHQHHSETPIQAQQQPARTNITEAEVSQFRLHQVKLALASSKLALTDQDAKKGPETSKSQPIYYRPPSSNIKGTQFGIQSFLPPNVDISGAKKETRNHVPLYVNSKSTPAQPAVSSVIQSLQQKKRPDLQEEDLDDAVDGPSGEWTNPIMQQALARQVDRESQTRRLFQNMLYLLSFHFFRTLVAKVWELYETRKQTQLQMQYHLHHPLASESTIGPDTDLVLAVVCWGVMAVFGINIASAVITLLRGQDQCYDLPLSDKQRRLIGLRGHYERDPGTAETTADAEDRSEEQQAELKLKQRHYASAQPVPVLPKYTKLNEYSQYKFTGTAPSETAIQLSSASPRGRHFLGGTVAKRADVTPEEKAAFARNFSVRFGGQS